METRRVTAPPLRNRRRAGAATLAALLALGGVACAGDDSTAPSTSGSGESEQTTTVVEETLPTPVQHLDIDARDYTFEITPDPSGGIQPGWTEITLRNVGAEAHQVMFARVKDGVDMADLAAAGAGDSSGAGAIEFVDMLGGVSYIGPDNEITAMVDLPEGMVLAMCYVPTSHGVAHALLGMSTTINVTSEAPAPAEDTDGPGRDETVQGTIELSGEGYVLPETFRPGWYRVVNTDTDDPATGLHELSILRLDREVEADEAAAMVEQLAANEVPEVGLTALGGLGAVSAGFEGYVHLDLPPGQYLVVDFMPDPGDPRPHMLDGYFTTFRI